MSVDFKMSGLVGVYQSNSVDFVRAAFEVYNSGKILVVLKEKNSDLPLERVIEPKSGGGWVTFKQPLIADNRPAQVVFTSGTEGKPKAILLSHRALADVVSRLNGLMDVDETISEYVGIPVTYSFGFGRCRAVAAAGGRFFIPENGFNPAEIAKMLEAGEINAISAVPTLWRALLGQSATIGKLGEKVRWIEIGSQYMSRAEKEQMKKLFPRAVIVQHYGLTEASRSTLLDISAAEGDELESVGKALGEVEVRISAEGRIQLRGPNVAMGRLVDGEIVSLVDEDGWYTTGDLGHIHDQNLYYEGRADDLINCGGIKVSPDLLQEKINRRLNTGNQIAVCRIADNIRGEGFFIAYESGCKVDAAQIMQATADELEQMGVNARSSIKIQQVMKIPKTDTGKVKRKDLAELFISSRETLAENIEPAGAASIAHIYARMFKGSAIRPDDTFRTLGGDSLNYIEMLMLLEKHFGYVPQDWDKMSIQQLERLDKSNKPSLVGWLDTSVFLRVLAIVGVVATHSGFMAMGGGTLLLFALIGYNMARFKSRDFMEGRIWPWIRNYSVIILIPYFIFMAMYLWQNKMFEIDEILLYANLVQARISTLFPFWFVQVLLQCLLLTGLLLTIPWLRERISARPFAFSFAILICLIGVRAGYPLVWQTAHLNDLVPLRFMAIMWLGWCFYFAETLKEKLMVCVSGIAFAVLDTGLMWGFDLSSPQMGIAGQTKWLLLGSVILAFVPRVPVPVFTRKLFNDIGAATFYIFILNGLLIKIVERVVPDEPRLLSFMVAMVCSMLIWWVSEKLGVIPRLQAAWAQRNSLPRAA